MQTLPDVTYQDRFSDMDLDSIIEQGMIYMCACPAQVADIMRKLRSLMNYQLQCSADPVNDTAVHAAIFKSTIESHEIMQKCLEAVIALEKWDRKTLKMPDGLRRRQMQELLSDS
jgi:hypothetical protein